MTRPVRQGRLLFRWLRRENDFMIDSPRREDGHLILDRLKRAAPTNHFDVLKYVEHGMPLLEALDRARDKTLFEELEDRGYDLTTIYFHADRKKAP